MTRRSLLLAGSALVLVAFGVLAFRPARAPQPDAVVDWGVYQIYWGRPSFAVGLARVEEMFATPPRYVMFFRDLAHLDYPTDALREIRARQAVPIVSLELWTWHRTKERHLPRLLDGAYDEALRRWARAARADGRRLLLRFGFEMNGSWFSWSGAPELYRRAWRHAHAIFRRAGAGNVEWVWSPNVASVPADDDMHRYYPGDDVVDWVALDGYNFGDGHDRWHAWQSFAAIFRAALDAFAERYPEKPVMIAETGCAADPRKAQWIRGAYAWLRGRPQVRALVWFNHDKRRENEPDWRIASDAEARRAFNETFAAPRK
ncbi:MAG: glycoside hydrolase family 26 protein [Planctomycetota bacterium]|jgi:hypothetical protein